MPLCHSHQSSALLHFRNSFAVGYFSYFCDLYSYPPKNSWKMGTDCCGWDGVTYDTMRGHVIGVDLSCSGLQGPIHPNSTLFSLRHLQRLILAYNDFHGSTISSKFGGFANMTHLNLTYSIAGFVTGSSFASNFPSEISHLSKLVSLDLKFKELLVRRCNFIGSSYPTFLSNLTQITHLSLSNSNFGGQCPWSLLNNVGLIYLDLSYNNFIGQLPEVTTNLTQIFSSNNSSNSQLVNKIPSNLEYLFLSSNLLNGTIPSWVYTIPSLRYLHLDHNKFTRHIFLFSLKE